MFSRTFFYIESKTKAFALLPNQFLSNNYIVPSFKLTKSQHRVTISATKLLKIILNIDENLIEKPEIFKAIIQTKLVLLENVILYF